jgi:hypothetical protein
MHCRYFSSLTSALALSINPAAISGCKSYYLPPLDNPERRIIASLHEAIPGIPDKLVEGERGTASLIQGDFA